MNPLPHDWRLNIALWVVIWSAIFLWQAVTVRSANLESFGSVVRLVRRWWLTRWVLLAAWAWLGWHLFVQTTY